MTYFKPGDRVILTKECAFRKFFTYASGIVVGYAFLQDGVPCVLLNMDEYVSAPKVWVPPVFTEYLVVPMSQVEPL